MTFEESGLVVGQTYALTLTFTVANDRQLVDVAIVDRNGISPVFLARILNDLAQQTVADGFEGEDAQ